MDLTPIDFSDSSRTALQTADVPALPVEAEGVGLMKTRWATIHEAVEAVTFFAGISPRHVGPDIESFPEAISRCGGRRRELAEQGMEDLVAVLEPGVAALLAVHESGADARPAAAALWQEFQIARDALLALVPVASEAHSA